MEKKEKPELNNKLKSFTDSFDPSELKEYFKNNAKLMDDVELDAFLSTVGTFLERHEVTHLQSQKNMNTIIEGIFQYYEFQNVFELDENQTKKAYQLFLKATEQHDLEKELTHDILVRLIVTTKLRIHTQKIHALDDDIQTSKQVAPECATALGILSAILSKLPLIDCEIKDIEKYEPYYSHVTLDEEMREFYQVDHHPQDAKLNKNTYFTHLAELTTLHNGFIWNQSFGFRESFYAQVLEFLFDYLSCVKVDTDILENFKESPFFMLGLTELINGFDKMSFKNNDILSIEKSYILLSHSFDKFLMENIIVEQAKSNQKIKI